MRKKRKCIVSIVATAILCFMFSISVAAIDTPWLPLEPDGEETTAEVTDAFESDGETESVPPTPTGSDQRETDTTDARDTTATSVECPIPQKGCSANYTPSLTLMILLASSTLFLRRRGEAGKHERRLYER